MLVKDILKGDSGPNKLKGDSGPNKLVGRAGNDELFGRAGNDHLEGGVGNDFLSGGIGADKLFGGAGRDKLAGGAGNDRLVGGVGADTLIGGRGKDTFVFNSADFGNTVDTVVDFAKNDLLEIEGFTFGVDTITTGTGGDVTFTLEATGDSITINFKNGFSEFTEANFA